MRKFIALIVLACCVLVAMGAATLPLEGRNTRLEVEGEVVFTPKPEAETDTVELPAADIPLAGEAAFQPKQRQTTLEVEGKLVTPEQKQAEEATVALPENDVPLAAAPVQPKQLSVPQQFAPPQAGPEMYTMAWAERYAPGSCAPYEEQVGDNGVYLEEADVKRPPPDTYRIVVDYYNQAVWAYSRDAYGDYTVLERVMICTTGGNGDWTPEGTYKMNKNYHRFGYFPSFNCYAQYWTQMWGNFYFHSILYRQRDASTLTKSSYNNLGKPGSHGCIRLLVPDARWLYENAAPGTICEVTTVFPKDEQLKSILKHGVEGAIDYAPTESEAAED